MQKPPPLTPYLVVSNAAAAISFYKAAFAATETDRHTFPGSDKIMHSRLHFNGALIMLSDDMPGPTRPSQTPEALGGTPIVLALQYDTDIDAAWNRAIAAGATIKMPLGDQFWGDRYGQLTDPFGHQWSMSQTIAHLSETEITQAAQSAFPDAVKP